MHLHSAGTPVNLDSVILGKITRVPIADISARDEYIPFLGTGPASDFNNDWDGYKAVLSSVACPIARPTEIPSVNDVPNLQYLSDGDVVRLNPSGIVHTLYRRNSRHNTILATERCNSLCLMCSQPPRDEADSYRVADILRLIELIHPDTQEIGISGGEPTLLGDGLVRILDKCEEYLPRTGIHVLTNGRLLQNRDFADQIGAIGHHDLMLGIPLYSDIDSQHDYVVQASGAHSATLAGLYNLARAGVPIEIRVVVHLQTYKRLPQLAEYIYRNLPFVAQVALMGMEMFGFVHKNFDALWIDPFDYQAELEEATLALAMRGVHVSVYNHQLCTVPRSIWPFTVKSISDWKNIYLEECASCSVREQCGGFFHSAVKKHSAHIRPL